MVREGKGVMRILQSTMLEIIQDTALPSVIREKTINFVLLWVHLIMQVVALMVTTMDTCVSMSVT